jgi:hypothetical protein
MRAGSLMILFHLRVGGGGGGAWRVPRAERQYLGGFQLSRSRGFEGISSSSTAYRMTLAKTERLRAIVVAPAARPSWRTEIASRRRRCAAPGPALPRRALALRRPPPGASAPPQPWRSR